MKKIGALVLILFMGLPLPIYAGYFNFFGSSDQSIDPTYKAALKQAKSARQQAKKLDADDEYSFRFDNLNQKFSKLEEKAPGYLPSARPIENLKEVTIQFYRLAVRSAHNKLQQNTRDKTDFSIDKLRREIEELEEKLKSDTTAGDKQKSDKSKSIIDLLPSHKTVLSDTKVRQYKHDIKTLQAQVKKLRHKLREQQKQAQKLLKRSQRIRHKNKEIKGRLSRLTKGQAALEDGRVHLSLTNDILFELGTADLKPSVQDTLDKAARIIQSIEGRTVYVEGHTDNVPLTRDHPMRDNWELSTQRALSVLNYLEGQGVQSERLRVYAAGQYEAVAPNTNPKNRSLNRRVDIAFVPKDINEARDLSEKLEKRTDD